MDRARSHRVERARTLRRGHADGLRTGCGRDGVGFLRRLADEWAIGANRFDEV
jgi:hypothetical protein